MVLGGVGLNKMKSAESCPVLLRNMNEMDLNSVCVEDVTLLAWEQTAEGQLHKIRLRQNHKQPATCLICIESQKQLYGLFKS